MTDDDKALKWLDDVIAQAVCFAGERTHARRIREMLGRVMTMEVTAAEIDVRRILEGIANGEDAKLNSFGAAWVLRRLNGEPEPPKTKIEWRVYWGTAFTDCTTPAALADEVVKRAALGKSVVVESREVVA